MQLTHAFTLIRTCAKNSSDRLQAFFSICYKSSTKGRRDKEENKEEMTKGKRMKQKGRKAERR
jgi:hypothetical protein